MNRKSYFFQMDVKSVTTTDKNTLIIEGYASTPDLDRYRDVVEPTAFSKALEMYMKNPVLLYQHDADRPIGNILSSVVTDKGLKIRAEIKDADAIEKVSDGRLRALSIGYIPLETELQHEDGTPFNFESDSIWDPNMIRVIKSLDLVEISIVSTPANGNALFTVAKSVKNYFEEVVTKSFGMKKKTAEDEAKIAADAAAAEQEAEKKPDEPKAPEAGAEAPKEDEGKEAPVVDPNANQAAADEAGAEPKQEDAEKPAETAGADGGEGVKPPEAPKAEAEPAEGGEAGEGEEGKALMVSETSAKAFPELVAAGHMVVAKDAEEMSKGVSALVRKLCDAFIAEGKRAQELQAKLDAIPAKQALVTHGQFAAALPKAVQKEPSEGFKKLFNLE